MSMRKLRKQVDPMNLFSWSNPPKGRPEVNTEPSVTVPSGDTSAEAIISRLSAIKLQELVDESRKGHYYDPKELRSIPIERSKDASIVSVSNAIKERLISDAIALDKKNQLEASQQALNASKKGQAAEGSASAPASAGGQPSPKSEA